VQQRVAKERVAEHQPIVGRAIELNGAPVTVVGVLPQSFDYGAVFSPGAKADLFVPVSLDKERMWGNIVTLVGRLKPGVTEAQALDDANRVAPDIYFNVKYPESRGRYKGNLVPIPLKDYVTGKLRRSLIALWFAVGTILLIAGVNLSNLLLARAAARAKEFAVRGALGAGRGRIVRQLLMESFVLSGAGALLGLGLAVVVIRWLAHQGSLALPLLSSLRIDNQALAWTLLVTVLTATVFGLLPGLRIARGNLQEVLKDSGAGAGLGRKHERIRAALTRLLLEIRRPVRREDNRAHGRTLLVSPPDQLQPFLAPVRGEVNVGDHHRVVVVREQLLAFADGHRAVHGEPGAREELAQREDDRVFVLDNQQPRGPRSLFIARHRCTHRTGRPSWWRGYSACLVM